MDTDTYFFIVNLRYTIGNWQHMESFATRLLNKGIPTRFLMSSGYKWVNTQYDNISFYTSYSSGVLSVLIDIISLISYRWYLIVKTFKRCPPAAILTVSWHPLNFFLILLARSLVPDIPVIAWLHEPYKEDKTVYRSKEIIIQLIEFFQTLSLRYTDIAVLHSHRALRQFEKRYPNFAGRKFVIPLQFQDYAAVTRQRRYISFLGRADQAKGIESFFALVADSDGDGADWEYQIVTSSNIEDYLKRLSPEARQRLVVVNRPQISDAELREGAAASLAVLALYKETTQSGLIPVALMQGTPLIGTDIEGITEWLRPGETGVMVPAEPTLEDVKGAIEYVVAHFEEMTGPCRAAYLATFDDRNWDRQYEWLPGLLQG